LTTALAGRSGAVWLRHGQGRLRMIGEVNDHARRIPDRQAHQQLLTAALERRGAVVLAAGAPLGDQARNFAPDTLVIGVVTLSSWLPPEWQGTPPDSDPEVEGAPLAIVEVALPEGRAPSSYRGARQLM